jgi:cell division septation protein DedD
MKIGSMMLAAGVLALGLATWITPAKAQGPMYDRVDVNLPYSVTIGDRTLPPGDYVIQQLRDVGGNSRVLLIYSDNGMKFQTSAMTIPTLDVNTPEQTSVILHHFGPDYYFEKIWIQGKDYGYEFPLPSSVKAREKERMEPVSVAATYSTTTQPAATQPQTTVAQTPPPAAPAPVTPAPQASPAPAPPPAMPTTNAGWLLMLLSGGSLSGAGMLLRRRKA